MATQQVALRPPLYPLDIEQIRNAPLFQFDKRTRYIVIACRAYGHKLGYHHVIELAQDVLNSGNNHPISLVFVPPVPALSARQTMAWLADIDMDMSPRSWEWSPEFVSIYGSLEDKPEGLWLYYSDFSRLMTTTVDQRLIPRFKRPFTWLAENLNFLYFCNSVDNLAVQKGVRVLDRNEMEAAWVQTMMKKFECETWGDILSLIGSDHYHRDITNEAQTRIAMQHLLRKAMKKRHGPPEAMKTYWEEKPAKYNVPDLDITPTPDGSSELPGELNTDFEDEDEEGDITMVNMDESAGVVEVSEAMEDLELDDSESESESESESDIDAPPRSGHTRDELLTIMSWDAERDSTND